MSRRASHAWPVVLALQMFAATGARAQAPESARLDSVMRVFAREGFMGSVLVARAGRPLLDRGYGLADRTRRLPNAPDTRFMIGSLTKQFTAAAVLLLEQRGMLRTTDTVTRWLPETRTRWDHVTLHQLLTHTAGIPDSGLGEGSAASERDGTACRRAVRRALGYALEFEPGSRFAHSNAGSVDAAGGLYSTTHDLLRWELALYGGRLLSRAALATMLAPVVQDYACGVHHRLVPGREVIYHTGRIDGFESVLGYYPSDSLAVVVLANLDGQKPNRIYDSLAAAGHPR